MFSNLSFSPSDPRIVVYGGVVVAVLWIVKKITSKRQLPLPPGPKGLPVFGNILDLPPKGLPEWEHWAKHKALYGPMSSVTILGQTIVLIHDIDIAVEMLDKKSVKFSNRPSMVFPKMCGYEHEMAILPYDRYHRQTRKLAAGQIGSTSSIARFHSLIDDQARRFLLYTLRKPYDLELNLQIQAASIILDMLFGYKVDPNGRDPLVVLANKFMAEFGEAIVAGAWLVDMIPWLRYLPDWVPGTGFKRIARDYTRTYEDTMNIPYNFAKEQKEKGIGEDRPSYISRLLDTNPDEDEIELIKNSAASLYGGGADTTVAALGFFFLAMTLYPEVQLKAREEIDRVVGNRLPTFEDRPNLPYVEAVVKETMRWIPIAPLCVPHTSDEEDEFRGYRIPKGSIVVPSIAFFAQDSNVYTQPDQFKPERFLGKLGPNELDPYSFAFGFGRRVCPGRRLADANMFLTIAQSLAVFEIKKLVDPKTGIEIDRVVGATPGLVSRPTTFHFDIKPRSDEHKALIEAIEIEKPWTGSDAKYLKGLRL
ncbi:hypothetical protein H072_11345 [Dactylellina haptotyla CBS 200.50]|uniref:Cytochrome P450 n=1 Tax=Dactylellina haptotyla (strain CBS 200.50) TaxID=1284197 RepID=S8A2B4_DACHA|nr:hypothetical protein H072_11345 [Dactylellina haptotyla CBS 200.50]